MMEGSVYTYRERKVKDRVLIPGNTIFHGRKGKKKNYIFYKYYFDTATVMV